MNLKDTEEVYTSIIDLVTKEIANIDQIRTTEAIDFLKQVFFFYSISLIIINLDQTWAEKLRNSGVFTQNQRSQDHHFVLFSLYSFSMSGKILPLLKDSSHFPFFF